MRKLSNWDAKDVSVIYWLTLWGLRSKDIIALSQDVIKDKTPFAIKGICTDVRKFILDLKGEVIKFPPRKNIKKLCEAAALIEPLKEITAFKPAEAFDVELFPLKKLTGSSRLGNKPNFEQLKEGEQNNFNPGEKTKGYQKELVHSILNKPLKGNVDVPVGFGKIGYSNTPKTEPAITTKQYSLEYVIKFARENGAKKVYWNGFTIKW